MTFFLKKVYKYRLSVIQHNLKFAFNNKSEPEINRLTNENYRAIARYISEIIKYPEKNLVQNDFLTFNNADILETYQPHKKHLILLASHLGNWELTIPNLPLITPFIVYGVYKPLSNKSLDQYLLKYRGKFGLKLSPMQNILRHLSTANQRQVYVFINDQSPPVNSEGKMIDFMGRSTKWYNGIEKLDNNFDCSFLYMQCNPQETGYEITFKELDSKRPLEDYVIHLEQDIRRYPAYWLWSHKRWK